ncbi:MAG: methyltransferase [Dongiaceae bacterium]
MSGRAAAAPTGSPIPDSPIPDSPAPALPAPAGARERWLALRDRLLASPRFQRWAAGFPLTRGIARRRARALFDLTAGFVYSQVLLACVRLRLLEALRDGPQAAAPLAVRLSIPIDGCERLLRAAAALRLTAPRAGGRWGLGDLGAALLGNPGAAAMVEHNALLYADLRDPVALLRGEAGATALGDYWPYAGAALPGALAADRVAAYSRLMAASQPMIAAEVLDAYPVGRHRCLLDLGGGEGGFVAAAAARAPALQLMLVDLPAVAARAEARLAGAGLAGRVQVLGRDFVRDPLPRGADLVTLVRVLHDHGDSAVAAILRAAHAALPPGGTLLIAEPMSGTPGAEPIGDAYFGLYLLAMGSGRPRSAGDLAALLRAAGFSSTGNRPVRQPLLTSVIVARRD